MSSMRAQNEPLSFAHLDVQSLLEEYPSSLEILNKTELYSGSLSIKGYIQWSGAGTGPLQPNSLAINTRQSFSLKLYILRSISGIMMPTSSSQVFNAFFSTLLKGFLFRQHRRRHCCQQQQRHTKLGFRHAIFQSTLQETTRALSNVCAPMNAKVSKIQPRTAPIFNSPAQKAFLCLKDENL